MKSRFSRATGMAAGSLALALFASACSGDDAEPSAAATEDTRPTSSATTSSEFPDWPNTDFSKTTIDSYIALKREEEQKVRTVPHPVEYQLYYSV